MNILKQLSESKIFCNDPNQKFVNILLFSTSNNIYCGTLLSSLSVVCWNFGHKHRTANLVKNLKITICQKFCLKRSFLVQ